MGSDASIELIGRSKEHVDIVDEFLGHQDSFHVRAIAHVEKHVGDAGRRRLFKGGEDAPDPVRPLLHLLLFLADREARLLARVLFHLDGLGGRLLGAREPDVPEFMDHVALRVPVLVLAVAVDLDELLENGRLAAVAALRELGRVVVVAVDVAPVLVVAVLGAKGRRAHGTGEVIDVVLSVDGRHVRAPQCAATIMADEIEPSEVVGFAEWILSIAGLVIDREELGGDNLTAVLYHRCQLHVRAITCARIAHLALEALQVKRPANGSHKLPRKLLAALPAYPLARWGLGLPATAIDLRSLSYRELARVAHGGRVCREVRRRRHLSARPLIDLFVARILIVALSA